jgi:mono/diheme cytochrome c family protein
MKKLFSAVLLSLAMAAPAFADDTGEIWTAKCKSCHGETGKADTKEGKKHKVADMTTAGWQGKWDDKAIQTAISEGVKNKDGSESKMKAFKDKLSEAEIKALVAHIRSFKK